MQQRLGKKGATLILWKVFIQFRVICWILCTFCYVIDFLLLCRCFTVTVYEEYYARAILAIIGLFVQPSICHCIKRCQLKSWNLHDRSYCQIRFNINSFPKFVGEGCNERRLSKVAIFRFYSHCISEMVQDGAKVCSWSLTGGHMCALYFFASIKVYVDSMVPTWTGDASWKWQFFSSLSRYNFGVVSFPFSYL